MVIGRRNNSFDEIRRIKSKMYLPEITGAGVARCWLGQRQAPGYFPGHNAALGCHTRMSFTTTAVQLKENGFIVL